RRDPAAVQRDQCACAAVTRDDDRRDRWWLLPAVEDVDNPHLGVGEIVPGDPGEWVRPQRGHQCGLGPGQERVRHGRIGRGTARGEELIRRLGLAVFFRIVVDQVGDVDGRQTDEQGFRHVVIMPAVAAVVPHDQSGGPSKTGPRPRKAATLFACESSYMLIMWPASPWMASLTASFSVGCACTLRATS